MVHPFLKRRNGEEPITYPSKEVEAVLARTMGVPIFQEQVIKLAMVAAGFTGGEADQLRRAMASWKKNGELLPFRDKLIKGMQARGYQTSFAERIFEQICGFGEYGFPESHSASFAVLAYVSAWLKYYHPAVFYTAILNSLPMGFYSASQLVQDAKRHGIRVLPVCINHSEYDHQVLKTANDEDEIRLGFRQIKGFSRAIAERIEAGRPEEGYQHLNQLVMLGLDKGGLARLASANALACFGTDRYQTRWNLMDNAQTLPIYQQSIEEPVAFFKAPDPFSTLHEDYATLGLSLGKHPITLLDEAGALPRFTRQQQLPLRPHKSITTVIGLVTGKQAPGTAGGVTFFTLEDDTGNINVVVWAGTARAQKQAYLTARLLEVKGIVEREGDVIHVIAGRLIDHSALLDQLKPKSREFH